MRTEHLETRTLTGDKQGRVIYWSEGDEVSWEHWKVSSYYSQTHSKDKQVRVKGVLFFDSGGMRVRLKWNNPYSSVYDGNRLDSITSQNAAGDADPAQRPEILSKWFA